MGGKNLEPWRAPRLNINTATEAQLVAEYKKFSRHIDEKFFAKKTGTRRQQAGPRQPNRTEAAFRDWFLSHHMVAEH
ncbi:MAG: hypothetical protein LBC18_00365, partial [Opitutaceae bacterium]|nr:hypothetical protein [Opitutaceae bacterium]